MLYEYPLTIPANTPSTNPKRLDVKLTKGIIHRIGIQFPTGCCGLVHVQVWDALHQVFPTNPEGNISADGIEVTGRVYQELRQPPFTLQLYGWNEDDTYDHTITFRFWILKRWQLGILPWFGKE